MLAKRKMKAIILAAGVSKRLRPMTDNVPKCLLNLNGESILSYQLECLSKFNVDQILLVTGYKKDLILSYVSQSRCKDLIKIIYNDIFERTDNAYSLALALDSVSAKTDSIIVLDGDIIFEIKLLIRLIESKYENVLIADNIKKIEAEDSKVLIEGGYVTGIGKKISGESVYTSMVKLEGMFLEEFKKEIKKPRKRPEWYSEPLNRLLIKYPQEVRVIYTDGLLRCEIDTYDDLTYAQEIYRQIKQKYGDSDEI